MKNLIILSAIILISSTVLAQTKAGKVDPTEHISFQSYTEQSASNPNLSQKELMKIAVTITNRTPVNITSNSYDGMCLLCNKTQYLSPKEKMKAHVVKLFPRCDSSKNSNKSHTCQATACM